ncbi:ImmA/IrrE family metallo-endopeptidase [Caballeronia sp. NK8]|nr:ImmA/IrrE family metallo-endopeptidase [Caballeronia sp. NK8]
MPRMAARYMLSEYWDGFLPVDPTVIARAAQVTVEHDPDLGDAFGRFEFLDGRPHIYTNPNEPEMRQRFTIAHELGHFMLDHGDWFVDTADEFATVQLDAIERQANIFALELLIPGFAVEILIEKRNIGSFETLREMFGVTEIALEHKLKRLGWAP